MREEYGIPIMLVPFELRPNLPVEGVSARDWGLGHSERVEAHLLSTAEKLGHPMTLPDHVPNTHLAMALGELARDIGEEIQWRVHAAIFDALYRDGRDIGSREVLLGLAEEEGLDTEDVVRAWDEGRFDDRLHEILHLGQYLGITVTPSAIICDELVVGSRPVNVLRGSVERCLRRYEAERGTGEGAASTSGTSNG